MDSRFIMAADDIVCFAKDWNEDPTSCNHVLRELSKSRRVLWINSIATRTPNLASRRDVRKIFSKLASFARGPNRVSDRLWVYTPIVLPFPHSRAAVAVNQWILRASVAILRRRMGMGPFQLWSWVPTASRYFGLFGESLIVYYCTDNWSQFGSVNAEQTERLVLDQARRANIVFGTSDLIVEHLRKHNPETHLAAHGVDHSLFARATDERAPVPDDLAALPGPVLGFYGLIEDWMDLELIAYLAQRHPDWSIALVGRVCVDTSRLDGLPNVHFLGRKPHGELPLYCKGFSVGLIPHKVNELTRHMNPIKLREYLSAGLPVVSTALPEVRHYAAHCTVAESHEEFEQGVEAAIRNDSPEARRARSASMRWETWESKVQEIVLHVERMRQREMRESAGVGCRV
ncbi:MAG TPA: glycosyltransferase [Chthonomonadaceae bacterium]|nr:glycosyltransferase [Chthonomonadaceae bacterium]